MPRKPSLVLIGLPRELPDRRTALADLRTALCLHTGVDLTDIHPASGHNLSLDAYLLSRRSYALALRDEPDSEQVREYARDARAYWERIRPRYLADHPWPDIPPPAVWWDDDGRIWVRTNEGDYITADEAWPDPPPA